MVSRHSQISFAALCASLGASFGAALPLSSALAADAEEGALAEVQITGSRIQSSGFTTPTPVTVLGEERLEQRGITNVADALNELPSFRASTTPATQQLGGGNIGARVLDLRGLGAVRTLVLVDGKRFVPSTSQGTLDINLLPSALISRTDVVTGGASAAYGSDAVAGVVNFIVNERLEGMRASANYGSSWRGDDEQVAFSFAGGTPFASGRGHFVGAFEFSDEKGLGDCYTRSWCGSEFLNLGNSPPGTNGRPANNILNDVHTATVSQDGVINAISASVAGPLRGTTFNPDGTTRAFQYGQFFGSNLLPLYMLGGEGHGENSFIDGFLMKVPVRRYATYTRTTFDLTDSLRAKFDVSFGRVEGDTVSGQYRDSAGSLANTQSFGPIRTGNAFLPTSLQTQMTQLGIQTFTLGRAFADVGNAIGESRNDTLRVVGALEGKLGGSWTWDSYYQFGKNDFRIDTSNNVAILRMRNAIDAVRNGANQVVCRINADAVTTNDDPACVAFNPFGRDRFSPEAKAYVTPTGWQTTDVKQHVVAANVQGELFQGWAGPIALAGGGEWRSDDLVGDADPISQANGYFVLNGQRLAGKIEVAEGYLETNVPLLRDVPLVQALELNGAVRRTHYDRTSPGLASSSLAVTTWKLGLNWEVNDWMRLRTTRSRDIRAPNLSELYGPQTVGGGALIDPRTGRQLNPQSVSGSNSALVPETANTWTAGVVFRPSGFLQGLQLSVDYYDIEVGGAIGTLGAQTVALRCEQGATEFCPLVDRDPVSGDITRVRNLLLNVNSVITRGFDIEAAYRLELGAAGRLDFRALGTIVNDLLTVDSAGPVQRAGMTGWRAGTVAGMPDWTADLLSTWTLNRLSL
ncbi:MAG: TonB-dependent receptor [Steroidobacteraceae bacterium]